MGTLNIHPPLRLKAVELRKPMQGGRTSPYMAVAMDDQGKQYHIVLKLKCPPTPKGDGHYCELSLVCELVYAMIAKSIGLSVPEYAIVDVTKEFVHAIPSKQNKELFRRSIGLNFGSKFYSNYAIWDKYNTNSDILLDQLEKILTFDSIVVNGDRKTKKPNLLYRGERILLIDHALASGYLWATSSPPLDAILPETEISSHCSSSLLRGKDRLFRGACEGWESEITDGYIRSLKANIPSEWQINNGSIDLLISFLLNRKSILQKAVEAIMRCMK